MQRLMYFAAPAVVTLAIIASVLPADPFFLGFGCAFLAAIVFLLIAIARGRAQVIVGTTAVVLLGTIAFFNWPLHVAYIASRPSFDDFAKRLRDGEKIQTPARIGMFRVVKAELNGNDVVCFWTDDDSAGGTAFVNFGSDNLPFNLWSHTRLDDSWQFIIED